MDAARLDTTLMRARTALLDHQTPAGSFKSELSSSALSTATASLAFAFAARTGRMADHEALAARGREWLCHHQRPDGGFGDTAESLPNVSTTTLAWVCLGFDPAPTPAVTAAVDRAAAWLREACGSLEPEDLARTIRARYGDDHTFSVPILFTCAIGGCLGSPRDGWRFVPALPFELAACPRGWFRVLRLRTVSYALPALIAIGQARHHHRPTRNPVTRALRAATRARTLDLLQRIQPSSGGFLEAAPLTSFVSLGLLSCGRGDHPVVTAGLRFLSETVREDGSWPIDTNLDTWVTSLSLQALDGDGQNGAPGDRPDAENLSRARTWLRQQQSTIEHPYTHAAAGAWAWTDLPGGVPDADDTAGALLALRCGGDKDAATRAAAVRGVRWLLDIQNRDGGIPTFCRGWGRLPFDRSSQDITAHALRAWSAWRVVLPEHLLARTTLAIDRGVAYLVRVQRRDGAWLPLWFGNQRAPREENPLYGTARVLLAASDVDPSQGLVAGWRLAAARAVRWMIQVQHADGGFGAAEGIPASIEETSLAVEALARWAKACGPPPAVDSTLRLALARGVTFLADRTRDGTTFTPSPIGLYFARLWYWERLYPIVFTVGALEQARGVLGRPPVQATRSGATPP